MLTMYFVGSTATYRMLWTVGYHWRRAKRMAFNCYRHFGLIYVLDAVDKPVHVIESQEGVD